MFMWIGVCPTSAQIKSGTVGVISHRQDQIAIAADSRITWKPSNTHDDSKCKIAALGTKMFFFNSGLESFGVPGSTGGWDNISEVHKVYDSIPAAERSGYSVLAAWRKITLEHFNAEYRSNPTSVIDYVKGHDSLLNEAYIGELTQDGRLRLIYMEFHVDQFSDKPISSTDRREMLPGTGTGKWDWVGEFPRGN